MENGVMEYDRNKIEALDPLNAENAIEKLVAVGQLLVESGFLPDAIKKPAQAVAIILTGREMGIPMMQALRQINVIQGKPTVSAELMLSQAYRTVAGFTHDVIERSEAKCVIKFKASGRADYMHEFTMKDAEGMQLSHKDNWKKQPKTMLFWRCVSGGLRVFVPQAVYGVYTAEEIAPDAVTVTEDGQPMIDQSKMKPAMTPEAAAVDKAVAKAKPVKEVKPEVVEPVVEKPAEAKPEKAKKAPAKEVAEKVPDPSLLDEGMVLKIVAAFSNSGVTREQLVQKVGKPTTEWVQQDRTNLLGAWKLLMAKEITVEQFMNG